MRQIIILTVFLLTNIICQGQNNKNIKTSTEANSLKKDTSFIPTDSTQLYFPSKLKGADKLHGSVDNKMINNFQNTWFSKHLFAMREPIIFSDTSQKEIFRFTWLRSFDNPVAIRIEKDSNTYLLFWKLCNGAGGYKPGQLIVDKQKIIDKQTWETFKNSLNVINFWEMPTNVTDLGFDGSQWILEGKNGNQYHVVNRWTPNEKSKFYQCCDFLIGLTDIQIKGDDKY